MSQIYSSASVSSYTAPCISSVPKLLLKGSLQLLLKPTYAAMQQAKAAYKAGNPDRARSELEWVMANAPDPVLVDLARLRLAALLVDQQQYDAAKEVIAAAGTFMKGDFEQLQGDIARAQGDKVAALAAYQAAASSGVTDMRLLSMKIVDVTPVEGK